jgi:predicted permease
VINFILIAVCVLSGLIIRYSGLLPNDAHKGINAWIVYIALPAVALKYIPAINWSYEMLLPAIAPVIIWAGSWLFFTLLGTTLALSKTTRAGLILVSGLGNTSFIGFPLVQAYYGESALSIAIICDQITFVLLSTIGLFTAINASGNGNLSLSVISKKLARFPMFFVFILALVLPHFFNMSHIAPLLDKLAGTLVPLALFSVGLQLHFSGWQKHIKPIATALSYKLILAPLLIFLLACILHLKGTTPQVSVFEASMAPMITAAVLASEYDLNPELSALVVGVGIPISFITSLAWWRLLQVIA